MILDVVYNHTGEGNEMGPSLCFRGIDNPSYYSLTGPADAPRRYYMNYTGCGNSLNFDSPAVIRLVMDSLRYWAEIMHVDGFRFDLASVLGRTGSRRRVRVLLAVLRRRLAGSGAQPRDPGRRAVGHRHLSGRQLPRRLVRVERHVPRHDAPLRRKATPASCADLGWRLTGSADLYGDDGRSAYNSINFVTCHDGFTLHDLVVLQRQAQRSQRREQSRRLRRQPLVELRRRRRHRPIAQILALRKQT